MPNAVLENQKAAIIQIFKSTCNGNIDMFIQIMAETMHEMISQEKQTLDLLPPVHRLETLVKWIDSNYPDDPNPEIQNDIREWIKNIYTIKHMHGVA